MSIAKARRHESVSARHLAFALLENEAGFAAQVLVSVGASLSKLRGEFEHARH